MTPERMATPYFVTSGDLDGARDLLAQALELAS